MIRPALLTALLLVAGLPAHAGDALTRICLPGDHCPIGEALGDPTQAGSTRQTKGASPKGVYIDPNRAPRLGALVLFDFDQDRLKSVSKPFLRRLAEELLRGELQDAQISIGGHADTQGPEAHNLKLSRRRAEAVERFLTAQGVAQTRLRIEAYGEDSSICPNDTETQRAWNRRVEFMRTGTLDERKRLIRSFEAVPGNRFQGDCNRPPRA